MGIMRGNEAKRIDKRMTSHPFLYITTLPFQNSPSFLLLLSHYFFIIQFLSNEQVLL